MANTGNSHGLTAATPQQHNAAMHPVLQQTFDVLAEPLAGSTPEALMRHPAGDPNAWSGWQVVDHLVRTWRATSASLEERLSKDRPLQTKPSLPQRVGQIAVCRLGYFPKGRQSPASVLPGANPETPIAGDPLVEDVRGILTELDGWLTRAERKVGRERVVTHPILGPLSAHDWRLFHRAHARHHAPHLQRAIQGS